jgi:hypothetical protein
MLQTALAVFLDFQSRPNLPALAGSCLAMAAYANLSHEFVQRLVLRSIDYVVQIERQPDGRKVTDVLEINARGELRQVYPISLNPMAGADTPATGFFSIRQ